ncbi:MAG: methylamine utilization protein MauE [Gammaproteobacteria bacterium]|nr:methylamine utilization protein MauE [Gammaproteobacteria bacterium]
MDPVLHLLLRGALALLFALAALAKWRQPRDFHGILLAYRLLPPWAVPGVARLLPWVEAVLATGLLAGWTAAWPAAALLLLGYAAAMAINLGRGRREIDCGCGGAAQPLSWWLVGRNGLLAAAVVAGGFAPVLPRALALIDAVVTIAALTGLALLYAAAHQLLANLPRHRALRDSA